MSNAATPIDDPDSPYHVDSRAFGRHLRSLRKARGLTQDALAKKAQLSTDTVRRLENGSFSPSLTTLINMTHGLGLRLQTVFESFDVGEISAAQELGDLLVGRSDREVELVLSMVRAVLAVTDEEGDG